MTSVATAQTNGLVNGHATNVSTPEPVMNFTTGLILPPPEIKSVIDRTAGFVAKSANPQLFEDKIRENQRSDPKFAFLNPADPYHAYYRHKLDRAVQGDLQEEAVVQRDQSGAEAEELAVIDVGTEPPATNFILDMPNISPIDLDIMKLTALFTARRGGAFLASLTKQEQRKGNFQFDFLRQNHSLFGYFNRLVEQYAKILRPNKDMLEQLNVRAEEGTRWKTLEVAKRHAKWEKLRREKDKKREDDQEAERIAFAEIDWHDYAIVQTIEFTAADAHSELPPPMSVQEVENMTLAQKAMAAMVMENTAEDVQAVRAQQAAAEAEAAAAQAQAAQAAYENAVANDEVQRVKDEARELERAKALQASSVGGTGPMKIRTDYVPKLGAKNKQAMTTCTICGQQIPVDELQEHMRIELLDPRWKEQRDAQELRKARASELISGANVVSSLKDLARTRVDIFGEEADEERRKKEEEEERERRKEREKVVWDGHTASKANTLDKYSTNVNFDEQIAAIHRAKGLGPQDANAIGPGIGPAAAPAPLTTLPPAPPSLPAPPTAVNPAYSAATVASGPQPASAALTYAPPPVMLPPIHFQDPSQQFGGGFQGPPGIHPSRLANMTAGAVRSADEMMDGNGTPDDMPPAKRQRVAKLPGGQLYPEEQWLAMHPHPISLLVQLPKDESRAEWKLDGKLVTIPELPLNLLVSTLRDRILQHTGSSVPVSRIRLSHQGKMLANGSSIASYNLEDEDQLVFSVSAPRRR